MDCLLPLLHKETLTVGALEKIYASHGAREGFVREVLRSLDLLQPETTWRALWLLLASARDGRIASDDLVQLSETPGDMTHWLSRLTFCQLLATTGCPPPARDDVFPILSECFEDRRVIVRAWAISALVHFDDPQFRKPIATMRHAAQKDSAKSMQARLRKLAPAVNKPRSHAPIPKP
jgi:hypothetical protein